MKTLNIDLETIKKYLAIKLKTREIQVHSINCHEKEKIILTLIIAGKKFCINIQADNKLYYTQLIMRQMKNFTPKILFYDQSHKLFPYDIMVNEYVGSLSLYDNIVVKNPVDFRSIGKAVRTLHELEPIPGLQIQNTVKKIHKYILTLTAMIKDRFPHLYKDIMQKIESPHPHKGNLVVSHNDLSGTNIMLNNKNLSIIDFDNAGYSLREYDLAHLVTTIGFPIPYTMRPYLINCAKKDLMHIIKNKKIIMAKCAEIMGHDFCSFQNEKWRKKTLKQILEGYELPVSQCLLSYYDCMIRLRKIIKRIVSSIYFENNESAQFTLVEVLILNDSINFSSGSIRELGNLIKSL